MPALRELSPRQYRSFRDRIDPLILADQRVTLFEFALQRMLLRHLDQHFEQAPPPAMRYRSLAPLLDLCAVLLSALAHAGKANEADVARAKEILDKAPQGQPLKTLPEIYARETVLLAKYPPKVKVILQALRVGDLGIGAIPCEVFVEIGLELRKKSPLPQTFTVELANGYNGYLPTPQQHQLGGYETWRARSSYLEVNASPKITRTMLGLLEKVNRSR